MIKSFALIVIEVLCGAMFGFCASFMTYMVLDVVIKAKKRRKNADLQSGRSSRKDKEPPGKPGDDGDPA